MSHTIKIPTQALRDPKPEVERIENLARRIVDADILLPKFQRSFVWDRNQIISLLDSISKNYPIGSVLLWLSKQKLQSENTIADLAVNKRPDEYPVNYLLDGQQRLSCICGALFWSGKNPESVWNLAYDLRAEKFLHLKTIDDQPLHLIKLSKLSDAAEYFKHVASLETLSTSDKDLLRGRAETLFKRFKDYAIATVTLSDMPIESVAPIFERINSTGTRLTIVDLMRAATWSEEFDLIDTIDGKVLEVLAPKGFEGIDRKVVLRSMSAAAGGGFTIESIDTLRSRTAEQLTEAANDTVNAYKKSADFLSDQIGVPNARIVPYVNQFAVLAEVFRTVPSPTNDQYKSLSNWFWRTTLSGYFGGWNSGQMSSDLEGIKRFANGSSDELDIGFFEPSPNIWKVRQFRSNNAHAKMLGLMLSRQSPRDLYSGQKITLQKALAWENEKEYHHFFPKAYLKSRKVSSQHINCVANFVLLSSISNKEISASRPSEYLKECRNRLGNDFESVISSNLISSDALAAAESDDFQGFLNARAITLNDHALALCGV